MALSGPIAGIVLAGGRSSRMEGQNKALALLAGEPLVTRAVNRLRTQVEALAINTNVALPASEYPAIADSVAGYPGPLAGVLAGMEWARQNNFTHIVTVACDTPFFPVDLVYRLRETKSGIIALASSGGRVHPVFGLWSVALADDLANYLRKDPRRSVLAFADDHDFATAEFRIGADDIDPFFNINSRQDLAEAERLAQKFGL